MLPSQSRRNFPGVDLLRALAALLVLAYHIVEYGQWTTVSNEGLGYVVRRGWVGVDLFLVISGFVITLSALDSRDRDPTGYRQSFVVRRLARIAPLYFLTCVLFVFIVAPALLLLPAGQLAFHVVSHALFLHNLHPGTHGSINGPTWSVGLEMQFYAVMLLATPWLARARAGRFLVGALVVAAAWRYGTTLLLEPGSAPAIIQFIWLTQLPGVIDEFAFGIAAAMLLHRGTPWFLGWTAPSWRNFAVWLAVAACLLGVVVYWERHAYYWGERWMLVIWRPLLAGGFVSMILAVLALPVAGHRVLAPIRYLGDISYGIYLWHMLVLISLMRGIPGLSGWYLAAYATGATLILAALSWHLLEKPNLERFRKSAARREPAPAARPVKDVPIAAHAEVAGEAREPARVSA